MQNNHRVCPKCGGVMHRQSKQCRSCYEKEKAKPESYIKKTCPVCKKEFTVHKTQIERGQGKYCSRACARKGSPTRKKTRLVLKCFVCGRKFERHLSEIKKNIGDKHFCSQECWYSYNQRENHYNWEGGQNERINPEARIWREKVLERDFYMCRLCHSQDNLEVHHIKRFTLNPELRWVVSNGVTLCHDCHVKFRNREEEYEEILAFIANVPLFILPIQEELIEERMANLPKTRQVSLF